MAQSIDRGFLVLKADVYLMSSLNIGGLLFGIILWTLIPAKIKGLLYVQLRVLMFEELLIFLLARDASNKLYIEWSHVQNTFAISLCL